MPFMAKLPPVLVGMEACGGAHYWARQLRGQGHGEIDGTAICETLCEDEQK